MTTIGLNQWSVKAETTYGTAVVPDRSMPIISEDLEPEFGLTSGADEQVFGSLTERVDQNDPYAAGISGSIEAFVPTKGFGIYLEHGLGAVSTGTVSDSNYTHTATLSATGKASKSMTGQFARPLSDGTQQLFTAEGLVITSLELSMDVDDFLRVKLDLDGEDHATGGSGTVTYPTYPVAGAAKFPWRLASITIDGNQVELEMFRVKITWPMDTNRRRLRGSALKKRPLPNGKPTIEFEAAADWSALTHYNTMAASSITSRIKPIVATFDGIAALGGSTLPQLQVTIPAARFDSGFPEASEEPNMQPLAGVGLYNGTDQPITITYRTTDSAA